MRKFLTSRLTGIVIIILMYGIIFYVSYCGSSSLMGMYDSLHPDDSNFSYMYLYTVCEKIVRYLPFFLIGMLMPWEWLCNGICNALAKAIPAVAFSAAVFCLIYCHVYSYSLVYPVFVQNMLYLVGILIYICYLTVTLDKTWKNKGSWVRGVAVDIIIAIALTAVYYIVCEQPFARSFLLFAGCQIAAALTCRTSKDGCKDNFRTGSRDNLGTKSCNNLKMNFIRLMSVLFVGLAGAFFTGKSGIITSWMPSLVSGEHVYGDVIRTSFDSFVSFHESHEVMLLFFLSPVNYMLIVVLTVLVVLLIYNSVTLGETKRRVLLILVSVCMFNIVLAVLSAIQLLPPFETLTPFHGITGISMLSSAILLRLYFNPYKAVYSLYLHMMIRKSKID